MVLQYFSIKFYDVLLSPRNIFNTAIEIVSGSQVFNSNVEGFTCAPLPISFGFCLLYLCLVPFKDLSQIEPVTPVDIRPASQHKWVKG